MEDIFHRITGCSLSSPAEPTPTPPSNSIALDVAELGNFTKPFKNCTQNWNIVKVTHQATHSIAADPFGGSAQVFKVDYPAGSYKPSGAPCPVGGLGFCAAPKSIFPARSVKLCYKLGFANNFNPNKGGKLPGLYIGPPGAAGGSHCNDNASARLMFRGNMKAEAYVYMPCPQNDAYCNIPNIDLNAKYGDSLWRGLLNFKKNGWNTIEMTATLNTLVGGSGLTIPGTPTNNGILKLTINGVTQEFNEFIWTVMPDSIISGINFTTFFGGSNDTWATPVDTSTYYKDFTLEKFA